MKKLLYALALLPVLTGSISVQAETIKQMPDHWQEIKEVVVHGDIPEVQGLPTKPDLPVSQYDINKINEGYINALSPSETWGNIIFASVFGMAILLGLFVIVNGSTKLTHGFSGKMIPRWSKSDIAIHWVGGISCLLLILTGVMLSAGRYLFEPMMTSSHWGGLVNGSVTLHNVMAFPFILGALLMMVKWAPKQMPEACDIGWFRAMGGYLNFGKFKGQHPDAGFANAGEKLWFWTFTLFGIIIIASGLLIMFPTALAVSKNTANLALILHIISAVVIGAFSMVHIFMATVMSEGGMECMVSGQCDENWAKQHHNLWYNQVSK